MSESFKVIQINLRIKAAIIFTLIVIGVYSPLIFLDQSYNYTRPIPAEFLIHLTKSVQFPDTIDPGADFEQNWPVMKLASDLILQGKIPLWNPYIGGGQPLAADSINYIFSPLMLGFLLPVQFWDIPLLIALWATGMFTFLFLRNLGLNFVSSIAGGIFYMLSGAFTWYLPHPTVAVMMFTPFILYSLEKIIQNRNPKYIVLTSIAFCVSILGAHIESIILQSLLVGLYLCYRIVYPVIFRRKHHDTILSENSQLSTHSAKRIASWSIFGFLGGIGLSAFLILPVYEFIKNASISHNITQGLAHDNLPVLLPAFVPYVMSTIQTYWSSTMPPIASWDSLWGYVGIFALFFSILSIYLSFKKNNNVHKYTPLFFLAISIFFMMKVVGLPIANWIGYLPVLNYLVFTRYAAIIIPFCFAISSAFGIDLLSKCEVKTKTLFIIGGISISIIFLLLIPYLPFLFSSDAKFAPSITSIDAIHYVGFQMFQAVLFTVMAILVSVTTIKNKSAISAIIPLILLELFLYIPVGLSPIWMAFKSIVVLCGMGVIMVLILKPNRLSWYLTNPKKLKLHVVITIFIISIGGGVLISELSPAGMMQRHDSFQHDPVTDFLKGNLNNSRMFSFDWTLAPNFPAAYKISTLGIMSASNIGSFYSFNHNFLDKDAWTSNLGYPSWVQAYGSPNSILKFFENKKYFDFLGVKYILTEGYDLNSFTPGGSRTGTYKDINSNNNNTGQSFIAPTENISGIGISFGTYLKQNHGHVVLTIDSVPYDVKYHRESIINAENILDAEFNEFKFTSPMTDTLNKQFYLSLKYPESNDQNKIAVFYYGKNTDSNFFDVVKNNLQGQFYEDGIPVEEKELAFSIINTDIPPAFKFHDINIYENKDAYPRAYLVNKFHVADDGKAQDYLIQNPDFDLRSDVVLETQLPHEIVNQLKSSVQSDSSKASIISYDTNKVTIHTTSDSSLLLILTDTYYPGWKALVDGKETPIYRADGLVRSVFVPSGNHDVEFLYMPESFVTGIMISLITAGVLVGILVYSRRKPSYNQQQTNLE